MNVIGQAFAISNNTSISPNIAESDSCLYNGISLIREMHEVLLSMNKGHSFRSSKGTKDEIKMYPLRIRGAVL